MTSPPPDDRLTRENAYLLQRNAQLQEDVVALTAEVDRLRQAADRLQGRRDASPERGPVTAMLVRDAKAAAYHCRALEATALAETCILDRVREKHEVAAARWLELAAMNERDPAVARIREETPCQA